MGYAGPYASSRVCLRRKRGAKGEGAITDGSKKRENRGVWRRLAGEQRTGGGGVGNGTECPFYRRALEGKMGDDGRFHVGA
jgi:hypothetical protein